MALWRPRRLEDLQRGPIASGEWRSAISAWAATIRCATSEEEKLLGEQMQGASR